MAVWISNQLKAHWGQMKAPTWDRQISSSHPSQRWTSIWHLHSFFPSANRLWKTGYPIKDPLLAPLLPSSLQMRAGWGLFAEPTLLDIPFTCFKNQLWLFLILTHVVFHLIQAIHVHAVEYASCRRLPHDYVEELTASSHTYLKMFVELFQNMLTLQTCYFKWYSS